MAGEEHIAEGARWIVVAEQKQQQSGWWQLAHAMGLDRPEGMALGFLLLVAFTWGTMRLARGLDKRGIAKAPASPQRVGHAVARSVRSAPLAKKEKLQSGVSRYAEPGKTFGGFVGATRGECAWRKVKPAEDDTPALWLCGRCNATYQQAEPTVPMTCLRGQ